MKLKILVIAITLIMLSSTFVASANVKDNDYLESSNSENEPIEIKVAVFTDDALDDDFYGPYGRTVHFLHALDNYSWQVGDKAYCIKTIILRTEDIIKGRLTTNNFDVLLYPPDSVNEYFTSYGIKISPKNRIRTNKMVNYVKSGGGFFGTCGGSLVAGDLENKPITLYEKLIKNCCLKISNANVFWKRGFPILGRLSEYGYKYPFYGAYVEFSGWNLTDYDINRHVGACLDVPILRDNAIFDDCCENTTRIRWISGPSYIIPEDSENIKVIARFPEEEISENDSTKINYWKYVGGIRGLIKALIFSKGGVLWGATLTPLIKAFVFAEDWKMMDDIVETNLSNKPFMITEIYQNENKARVVRCTGHPEHNVWWGGHIEELEDTKNNNVYDGFHRWRDIIPENDTVEDEFTYTFWINRRSVAWASKKVPDNDLPPIYGPSQVCDIYPYNQSSSEIIIYGNSETADGVVTLDLYYRYSVDNSSWGNWTLYKTDEYDSDGWSWDFNAPNSTGYYEFYSIRKVEYEGHTDIEKVPPGPDAIVNVNGY